MNASRETGSDSEGPDKYARRSEQETLRIDGPHGTVSSARASEPVPPPQFSKQGGSLSSKYVVLERVADGGMGVLYLAQDRQLGRFVAVKRINTRAMGNVSMKQRMMQEAKVVAALRHPNIVHIYELGEDEDGPYIVMEYLAGPAESSPNKTPAAPFSLADHVHRNGSMDAGEALALMIKISRAAEHAHRCGVIHRDLKPSNILFDENMEPKIVDFGLARAPLRSGDPITQPGDRFLSLGYGAPEQERDATLTDERSDVYGLGALLFFCLTGQNPRFFRPDDVPDELRMPIVKALEPDKEKRWASVSEFLETLLLINAPDVVELPSVKRTWRCRWCDSVNPTSIRFCGKCGWDGGETCFECKAETRTGLPFCGHCGADARDYEAAVRLYHDLQSHFHDKEYRHVVEKADAISGFTPNGPVGRQLVGDVYTLKTTSEKSLKRISQLRQIIPLDISSGAYIRARDHIEEYDRIANDEAFREEAARLKSLMVDRYLETARVSINHRQWERAAEACHAITTGLDEGNREAKRLLARLKFKRGLYKTRLTVSFVIILFFAYLFSAAPMYLLLKRPEAGKFFRVYRLAEWVEDHSILRGPLADYGARWGVYNMFGSEERGRATTLKSTAKTSDSQLETVKREYLAAIAQVESSFSQNTASWPSRYVKRLIELKTKAQRNGDYDAWELTQQELVRFDATEEIGASDFVGPDGELLDTQKEFREQWLAYVQNRNRDAEALTQGYIDSLKELRSAYTKMGKMTEARQVDEEIDRTVVSPSARAAEGDHSIRRRMPSPLSKPPPR